MNAPWARDATARLVAAAREILPPSVAIAATDPRLDEGVLLPEEASAIAGAVDRRRREFIAGRVAARRAMAALGVPARPVLSGRDRAPLWPKGLVGGISHSPTHCLAVVARSRDIRAIGIDVEPNQPLPADLLDSICTDAETAWLDSQLPVDRLRLAKLLFSAKESVYKCQYPLTGTLLGFHQTDARVDRAARRFTATIQPTDGAPGYQLHGTYRFVADAILTAVVLTHGQPDPLPDHSSPTNR